MSEAALAGGQSNYSAQQTRMGGGQDAAKLGDIANELFDKYGVATVQQAVNNAASEQLKTAMNDFIDTLPMPQFMKDDAKGAISDVLQGFESATPGDAGNGTRSVLGESGGESGGKSEAANSASSGGSSAAGGGDAAEGMGKSVVQGVMDSLKSDMQEETKNASGKGGTGGGGNWLAILARSLGKTAGEHLKKMVELGEKMGELDSKENPEEFAKIQSEFQAESQIFKMFQEAIGTMVKSIGEGMSTVARKQ